MKYILIIVISLYILFNFIAMFSEKHNAKQNAKFKRELNERCDNILESVSRTEATIAEDRKLYWTLPKEHREQFLAKYEKVEKKCQAIRTDVARIRASIESEGDVCEQGV